MKNFLLCLGLMANQFTFSQGAVPELNTRRFYLTGYNVTANDILKTKDGGNIVVGNMPYVSDNSLAFAVKSDAQGNVIWNKPFSCFNSMFDFSALTELPDSSIVIVGRMFNPLNNKYGAACQKLDKNGNVIWSKAINSSDDAITHASNIIVSSDTNLLIAGYVDGFSSFLVKLDTSGTLLFGKTYKSTNNTAANLFKINSLVELDDHSIAMVGTANWGTSEPVGIAIKTDSTGHVIWSKNSTVIANFLDVTNDADFLYLNDNGNLVKLSQQGNIEWKKFVSDMNQNTFFGEQRFRIKRDLDSNLIVLASNFSFSVAAKVDRNGNSLKTLGSMGQVIDLEFLDSTNLITLTSGPSYGVKSTLFDRHFAISRLDSLDQPTNCNWGYSVSPSTQLYTHSDFPLVLDSSIVMVDAMMELFNGNFTVDSACVQFLGGIDELASETLNVFPNPANDQITIQSTGFLANSVLHIYNQQGRLVKSNYDLKEDEITVSISDLTKGIYLIEIGNQKTRFIKD